MGNIPKEQVAQAMVMLVLAGESCSTCTHCNDPYGDCPFEPDARNQKPVLEGTKICHKHSKGPYSR